MAKPTDKVIRGRLMYLFCVIRLKFVLYRILSVLEYCFYIILYLKKFDLNRLQTVLHFYFRNIHFYFKVFFYACVKLSNSSKPYRIINKTPHYICSVFLQMDRFPESLKNRKKITINSERHTQS